MSIIAVYTSDGIWNTARQKIAGGGGIHKSKASFVFRVSFLSQQSRDRWYILRIHIYIYDIYTFVYILLYIVAVKTATDMHPRAVGWSHSRILSTVLSTSYCIFTVCGSEKQPICTTAVCSAVFQRSNYGRSMADHACFSHPPSLCTCITCAPCILYYTAVVMTCCTSAYCCTAVKVLTDSSNAVPAIYSSIYSSICTSILRTS